MLDSLLWHSLQKLPKLKRVSLYHIYVQRKRLTRGYTKYPHSVCECIQDPWTLCNFCYKVVFKLYLGVSGNRHHSFCGRSSYSSLCTCRICRRWGFACSFTGLLNLQTMSQIHASWVLCSIEVRIITVITMNCLF